MHDQFKKLGDSLQEGEGLAKIQKVKELTKLAESGAFYFPSSLPCFLRHSSFALTLPVLTHRWTTFVELNCSITHLALAWVAVNPNTSTVILGASKPEQVLDNLQAIEVIPKLTPEIMAKIEAILENKPTPLVRLVSCVQFALRRRSSCGFIFFPFRRSPLLTGQRWISLVGCRMSTV